MDRQEIFIKNNVRVIVTDALDLSNEILKRHQTKPLSGKILSSAIVGFLPIGTQTSERKSILTINGGGASKQIIVEVVENKVRALIGNPFITSEYDKDRFNDIPLILGIGDQGYLQIVNGEGEKAYGGQVPLANADIVTDLVYYMDQSQQTKSALVVDAHLKDQNQLDRCRSVFFEMLPGYTEADVVWVERFVKKNKLPEMEWSDYIDKMEARKVGEISLEWHRTCSRKKMKQVIDTLSKEEREEIIADQGQIEIQCEFCKNKYTFRH